MMTGSLVQGYAAVALPAEAWGARLLTGLGLVIDTALLRAMSMVVEAAVMPNKEDVPALRAAAKPYLTEELQRQPQKFFAFLAETSRPVLVSERFRRSLSGGVVVDRRFLSNYRRYAESEDGGDPCLDNERVPVQHWMHQPETPRATVVALHGFTMGQPRVDAFGLMASEWFHRGMDVAMMTLPYHGARSPRQARFSGEFFASPNPARLNEAVRQAVHDVHMLITWLRERNDAPIGILGLSLGGYVSALMAGLTDEADFVIPIVPPVCMADLASRLGQPNTSGNGSGPPLSEEEQRAVYGIHSPLRHALKMPKNRVLIVAGRGDRVVPPEHPYALWKHWGEPSIYWFSGSHIAPFARKRIAAAVAKHLQKLDIL